MSLKIPKELSKATDNTMAKRKGTNKYLQNTTQRTKDRATRTTLKTGVQNGRQFLFRYNIYHLTYVIFEYLF